MVRRHTCLGAPDQGKRCALAPSGYSCGWAAAAALLSGGALWLGADSLARSPKLLQPPCAGARFPDIGDSCTSLLCTELSDGKACLHLIAIVCLGQSRSRLGWVSPYLAICPLRRGRVGASRLAFPSKGHRDGGCLSCYGVELHSRLMRPLCCLVS